MHQRLTFKRNPRYPLPASMALLDTMALAADKPQWLGTTGRPRPSPAELAASRAAARSRRVEVFRVEPEPLVFSSYEAGYTYQQVRGCGVSMRQAGVVVCQQTGGCAVGML
jgi:hypothetical protein